MDKLTYLKEQFISSASHELGTPLTSLKASLQLLNQLTDDKYDQKKQVLLDKANNGLNKLIHLVELFIATAKLESGQLLPQCSTFKAMEVVKTVILDHGFSRTHRIELKGDDLLEVRADKERIEQVIVNTLNNAVKFSKKNSVIDIGIQRAETTVKFIISDRGIGIAPDDLPYIFDRYYKGGGSRLHLSGLGLGLFISKEIIKSHAGEIGVESEKDVGSTFWFKLPISKSAS